MTKQEYEKIRWLLKEQTNYKEKLKYLEADYNIKITIKDKSQFVHEYYLEADEIDVIVDYYKHRLLS